MKRINALLFTLLLMLAPVVALAQATDIDAPVGDFSSLIVQDAIDVVVVQDSARAGHATFTATKRVANCLIFSNNGKGRLKIEVDELRLGNEPAPVVTVYSSGLTKVENDNTGSLTVKGLPALEAFEAVNTGNGKIDIEQVNINTLTLKSVTGKGTIKAVGRCDLLKVRLLGGGTIDAEACEAISAHCHVTGVGSVRVYVERGELRLKGSGSGRVYYRGHPLNVVNHKLIGGMKAIPIED